MYQSDELTIAQNQEKLTRTINDLITSRIDLGNKEEYLEQYFLSYLLNLPYAWDLPKDTLRNYQTFVLHELRQTLHTIFSEIFHTKNRKSYLRESIIQKVQYQTVKVPNEIQHEIRLIKDQQILFVTMTYAVQQILSCVERHLEQCFKVRYGSRGKIAWVSTWEYETSRMVEKSMRFLNLDYGQHIVYQENLYFPIRI